MGTKLGDIIQTQSISLAELSGKKIAVDAFNTLYQFLASIRQPDGTPLMDRKGQVTSHLSGIFYRNISLLEHGILPVYVFDGKSPELKAKEVERRREIRETAYTEWQQAKKEGRIEDARKAGQASSRLTKDMIEESKSLLSAMGIPHIQAPSEGEALAAQMAREGIVWASASQDNDSLLYNCPRMIKNLSISGRRRVSRAKTFKTISPEVIDLDLNLKLLGLTREQLIDIAMLIGTDYNDKVPNVGPKTALKLIKKHGCLEVIIKEENKKIEFPYEEIREIFLNSPRIDVSTPEWRNPDLEKLTTMLCSGHDFSVSRVQSSIENLIKKLEDVRGDTQQSSLTDFF
ncbi:MAG: flap endonuclease-1 [Candidatus Thorarchaeota archaeon]|nr:flap endonuclease-1 [Candidatus Thorarchaeota archaeon]